MNIHRTIVLITTVLTSTAMAFAKDHNHKNHKDHTHESSHAHDKTHTHDNVKATARKIAKDKIVLKVNGMVCAFCAQGIEKNFNAREEVKETDVDLDTMQVTIKLNKGKDLSEETIKDVVTGAGFQFVGLVKDSESKDSVKKKKQ